MGDITQIYDLFFKESFSIKQNVKDFLHHHLPVEIIEPLDLHTIELQKDASVNPDLQAHYSDLLDSVKRTDGNNLYIHILFSSTKVFRNLM